MRRVPEPLTVWPSAAWRGPWLVATHSPASEIARAFPIGPEAPGRTRSAPRWPARHEPTKVPGPMRLTPLARCVS
jgi:hypothetical protein